MDRGVFMVRIWMAFAVLVAGFGGVAWQLYRLQVQRHDELRAEARRTYTSSLVMHGQRGLILDRRGNLLVGNVACKDILAEPRRMPAARVPEVIAALVRELGLDGELLTRRFASGAVEVVVARTVSLEQADRVAALGLPGLRLVDRPRRTYPKGSLLANVLGFTDSDHRGLHGLEVMWDKELAPRSERVTFERDRRGRMLVRGIPTDDLAVLDGKSLVLTIDEPIQTIVEKELAALGAEHAPSYAYAIMVAPHTGAVMAMAQWPSFDPNDRSTMDPRLWINHMISDVYDPGSTMKAVAIAGALDYGQVTLATKFDCEMGRWVYGKRSLRDGGRHFGILSVAEIIQHSSNIGTAKIAIDMGESRLYQVFLRFGFGQPTGIGLPHESRGILRSPRHWDTLSITRFPIGQGISVTPPQMVQAYAAIANGGQLPKLRLVERLVDPATATATEYPPEFRQWSVRPKAAAQITEALKRVPTREGTARAAAIPGYTVAGKTGTSQKFIDGSYANHSKYVVSFIGFVPADAPAFVLLVAADEPSKGVYSGGGVAAPVFRRISEQTLRYLNVPPDAYRAPGGDARLADRHARP